MNVRMQIHRIVFLFGLTIVLAGCEMPTGFEKTNAWIDVPVDGITVPEGQIIQIKGHASNPQGTSKIEIWINGELYFEIEDPPTQGKLSMFSQEWLPPRPGEYTIQVLAIGGDGSASDPDNARVQVGAPIAEVQPVPEGEPADDGPTLTPTATATPTPTPPTASEVVIEFWADPGEINAGGKFTVHWHVENVREVFFGGMEQPFDGSYSDYLCKNERYTLTVIHEDGREEKRSVNITVNGQCEQPEEESQDSTEEESGSEDQPPSQGGESSSAGQAPSQGGDSTPPPAPNLLKPVNSSDLGCVSSVMLRWEAVSDDSGIVEYQVVVQRHPGDNKWSNVSGSPYTGIGGTEKENSVECGWEYRWQVRAIDGAGNAGDWSGWFTFVIPLT